MKLLDKIGFTHTHTHMVIVSEKTQILKYPAA